MTEKEIIDKQIELLQAKKDGKIIQILAGGDWHDQKNNINFSDCNIFKYRIKPEPEEPTYRPYKDFAEFRADWEKHGGWVYSRLSETIFLHSTFDDMEFTLNNYVWAEDGSPCGVLIEKGGEE